MTLEERERLASAAKAKRAQGMTAHPDIGAFENVACDPDETLSLIKQLKEAREALLDATAHLVAASSAYEIYARRYVGITPKAKTDAFYSTRVQDFKRAADRAAAAILALSTTKGTEVET